MSTDTVRVIDAADLNEMDRWILDYLAREGRATPNLLRLEHRDEQIREDDDIDREILPAEERNEYAVSRQWVSSRLRRLAEHGHIQSVHPEAAVYELVHDPRGEDDE